MSVILSYNIVVLCYGSHGKLMHLLQRALVRVPER